MQIPTMLREIIEFKEKLAEIIGETLTKEEKEEALRDHHARRPSRPCGMTIHTGIGCTLRCTYCYIEDMGFPWRVKPYPLNGRQLVYALLKNPSFIPGRNGTLIAIGSVTEPFLPETRGKTIEYIENIAEYLGNPIQFSTKMPLTRSDAERIARADPGISPLITIITIEHHRNLEPYAPPPELRFKTMTILADQGLKPILFYRPIIPGVAEKEYQYILEEAKQHGAVGVVAGTLRVTPRILEKLRKNGILVEEIIKRLPRRPRPREQVPVYTRDIKEKILGYARKIGLIAFPEACMANLYTHGYTCWKMISLGITSKSMPPEKSLERIRKDLLLNGFEILNAKWDNNYRVRLTLSRRHRRDKGLIEEYVKCKYKLCIRTLYK